jgi:nucleotide-binding universal stress UspA family protein
MYRTIVLAYDGSLEGRLALREGARLAQICKARVFLVAVVEYGPESYASDFGSVYAPTDRTSDVQNILDEGVERLKRMGLAPEARLERGAPSERITSVAKEVGADLVVVGHHKQGAIARWLKGSVTTDLSNSLSCSLLVARLEVSEDVVFSANVEMGSSEAQRLDD